VEDERGTAEAAVPKTTRRASAEPESAAQADGPPEAEHLPGLPKLRRTPHVPATGRRRARRVGIAPGEGEAEPPVDLEALRLARRVVDLAADKKASDIVLLDVHALTSVTDYFVICTGASERQLGAIADGIVAGVREEGIRPLGREGDTGARWLLLDLGSVIVHVMGGAERDLYALERLWSEAPLLVRVL
jgi:ribosome-associated protein